MSRFRRHKKKCGGHSNGYRHHGRVCRSSCRKQKSALVSRNGGTYSLDYSGSRRGQKVVGSPDCLGYIDHTDTTADQRLIPVVKLFDMARNPKRKGKGLQNLIWWFNSIPRLHLPKILLFTLWMFRRCFLSIGNGAPERSDCRHC